MMMAYVENAEAQPLAHNWGAVVLRGVLAILFGLFALFAPRISLAVLVLWFGAFALIDGVLELVAALRHRASERWGWLALQGVCGIAAGVVTFLWPGITALVLLYLIAAWAIVRGILERAVAIRLRRAIQGEWLLLLSGVASVALGVLLMLSPVAGALALVMWIGAFALVSGVLLLGLGLRLRGWDRSHMEPAPASV
jgi:uncharacterized membrane protein HdeD (DUF308 family)